GGCWAGRASCDTCGCAATGCLVAAAWFVAPGVTAGAGGAAGGAGAVSAGTVGGSGMYRPSLGSIGIPSGTAAAFVAHRASATGANFPSLITAFHRKHRGPREGGKAPGGTVSKQIRNEKSYFEILNLDCKYTVEPGKWRTRGLSREATCQQPALRKSSHRTRPAAARRRCI